MHVATNSSVIVVDVFVAHREFFYFHLWNAVFHYFESIIRKLVSTEIVTFDDCKDNCKSSWLGKHGASFLLIWFSPCVILDFLCTVFSSSIILSEQGFI